MSAAPPEGPSPRPAATIVLMREADTPPFEVLLLRRHARSGFAASAWVFPGGVVDAADADLDDALWSGIDPEVLAGRFDLPAADVLALHVAAVRETFEEAGVLLAHRRDGEPVDVTAAPFVEVRRTLNDRTVDESDRAVDWPAFLREQDLVLDLGAVTYLSRWITPVQEPRRYDTSFFVARMPAGVTAAADNVEMTESRWLTPRQALDDDGTQVIFPTEKTLELLAGFESPDAVVAHATAQEVVDVIQPHILVRDDGSYEAIVLPDDPRHPDGAAR
ncbi:NUDIX domain-containing protein [Euzebya sp.]|uniref:NUDIX domain-containing protein n=1 Tax=Euzebya sp. TaxID=1971409 RepID=UPI0035135670